MGRMYENHDERPVLNPGHVRRILQLSVLVLGGLLFACEKRGTRSPVVSDPTGSYTLVTVNGLELPATVTHGEVKIEVRSGNFVINTDGTCSSLVVFVAPSGDPINREVRATYTREGAELSMEWEGAGTTTGTVEGDAFTMDNKGMVFAYKKQ